MTVSLPVDSFSSNYHDSPVDPDAGMRTVEWRTTASLPSVFLTGEIQPERLSFLCLRHQCLTAEAEVGALEPHCGS